MSWAAYGWTLPWLVVAVTLMVTMVQLILAKWAPISDNAIITAFTMDSWDLSTIPRLGMPTSLASRVGQPVRHPGPLQFWMLAIPARVFGAPGYGVAIGSTAIHLGLVAATAVCARTLRPRWLTWVLPVVALLLVSHGLGHAGVVNPFNSNPLVLGLLASAVALWSLGQGHHGALPVFVACGSLTAQVHVTGLPAVGILALGAIAIVVSDVVRRDRDDPVRRRLLRRIVPWSVGLGLLLWSGPIVDQLFGTGNLLALLTSGSNIATAGPGLALRRAAVELGFPPRWAWAPGRRPGDDPSVVAMVTSLVLVGSLLLGAVAGVRRRHRDLVATALVGLVLLAAAVALSARLPGDAGQLRSPTNRMIWWPTSAVTWITAAVCAGRVLGPTVAPRLAGLRSARDRMPRWAGPAAAAVAALMVAVPFVADAERENEIGSLLWGPVRQHADRIGEAAGPGGTVRLKAPGTDIITYTMLQSLIGQLRLDGYQVDVDVVDPFGFFRAYKGEHGFVPDPDVIVYVQASDKLPPPPRGTASLLSSWNPRHPTPTFVNHRQRTEFLVGEQVTRVFLVHRDSELAQPYDR